MDKLQEAAAFHGLAMNMAMSDSERLDMALTALKRQESIIEYYQRELMELKGPCSSEECRLHYAHSGPCWI